MKEMPKEIAERLIFKSQSEERAAYPVLEKVVPLTKPCEDCGIIVTGRTEEIRQYTFPREHWRRQCAHCKLYWNPDTRKYDIDEETAKAFFRRRLKNKTK